MWISEFARRAGVSADTVRFYVRQGLLRPAVGGRGATNRYQEFSEEDVRLVGTIRVGQVLGLSLQEIQRLLVRQRAGGAGAGLRTLREIRERLRTRAAEIAAMQAFVDAKIAWLEAPDGRAMPHMADFPGAPPARRVRRKGSAP